MLYKLKILMARIKIANRELRGLRTILLKLFLAIFTMPLSLAGVLLVIAGWRETGLAIVLLGNVLLSVAIGISALKTLRTAVPIMQRRK